MPETFLLRFQERKLLLPARVPAPKEVLPPQCLPGTQKGSRGTGQRESVAARLERIKEQLQDPAFAEAHQRYVWRETAWPLGQLVFAGVDLPWGDLARQAREIRGRLADAPAQRTVREGLAALPEPIYCGAARLYHAVRDALTDYPAMRQLLEQYCTEAASSNCADTLQILNTALRAAWSEDGDTPAEKQLRAEIDRVYTLETFSEWFEEYLRSWPEPGRRMREKPDAPDGPLCAAAGHFLALFAEQLEALADWQPGLAALTAYTLGAADAAPEKPADRRWWEAQLTGAPGIRQAEALNEQLGMRMLGRLSLPEEKPNARKRPDVSGRMFFSAPSLAALTAAELQQMCVQQLTARRCGRCGKLFVPFSASAKYCGRLAPNGGKCSCKKAASIEAAETNRRDHPAVAVYTTVNNRLGTQLSRRAGFPKERRQRVMALWRAAVKPLVDEAVRQAQGDPTTQTQMTQLAQSRPTAHLLSPIEPPTQGFNPAAFDQQLTACFPAALAQEAKEWARKRAANPGKKSGNNPAPF